MVMKKLISLFVALIFTITVWGQLYSTTSNVKLRIDPNPDGTILTTVPRGTLVTVSEVVEGWSKVTYNKKVGYLNNSYLKPFNSHDSPGNTKNTYKNSLDSSTHVKYYKNSNGERVQSPTYYTTAPAGATAECRDGTYSFSRNRRGTCSHHGGVKKWLK